MIEFCESAQFSSNPIKALFFKAFEGIRSSFQQSYPQFFGTASKALEKQQLTCDFKNIYEQENDKMHSQRNLTIQTKVLDANVA